MIDVAAIREIVAVYVKYGWTLRRVMLSGALKKSFSESPVEIFGEVPIIDSDLDAAWFSRPPVTGGVAWEIRHLTEVPYALLENIDEYDAEFERTLQAVEARLRMTVTAKKPA